MEKHHPMPSDSKSDPYHCPQNESGHVYEFHMPNNATNTVSRCRYCFQPLPGCPVGGIAPVSIDQFERIH